MPFIKGYKQSKEHIAKRSKPRIFNTTKVYKYKYPVGLTALERRNFRDKVRKRIARKINPKKYIEETKKNIAKNKVAHLARKKLQNAVKRGKLKRGKCRDCKRKDTHGHHPDYSKPLDIVWLCPSHHKLEHIKIKLFIKKRSSQSLN